MPLDSQAIFLHQQRVSMPCRCFDNISLTVKTIVMSNQFLRKICYYVDNYIFFDGAIILNNIIKIIYWTYNIVGLLNIIHKFWNKIMWLHTICLLSYPFNDIVLWSGNKWNIFGREWGFLYLPVPVSIHSLSLLLCHGQTVSSMCYYTHRTVQLSDSNLVKHQNICNFIVIVAFLISVL